MNDVSNSGEAKIFVGGLPQETTSESLRAHFSHYGTISDCIVMFDKETGRSRGFGFVKFDDIGAVDAVVSEKQIIDGKEVECKRATPRESYNNSKQQMHHGPRTDKIFVGGLPDVTQDEFKIYFEQFGRVTDVCLMTDKNSGKPRGFGFVTFERPECVDEVLRKYNSHRLNGKWVEVKPATPRDAMNRGHAGRNFPGPNYMSGNQHFHRGGGSSGGGSSGGYDSYRPPIMNTPPHSGGVPDRRNYYGWYGNEPSGGYDSYKDGGHRMDGGSMPRGGAGYDSGFSRGGAPMGDNYSQPPSGSWQNGYSFYVDKSVQQPYGNAPVTMPSPSYNPVAPQVMPSGGYHTYGVSNVPHMGYGAAPTNPSYGGATQPQQTSMPGAGVNYMSPAYNSFGPQRTATRPGGGSGGGGGGGGNRAYPY